MCHDCEFEFGDRLHYDGKKLIKLCGNCHKMRHKLGKTGYPHPDHPNLLMLSKDDHKLLHEK